VCAWPYSAKRIYLPRKLGNVHSSILSQNIFQISTSARQNRCQGMLNQEIISFSLKMMFDSAGFNRTLWYGALPVTKIDIGRSLGICS
jgi:hypothetical protein